MRAIWIIPVLVSILILGTLGFSQDAFAFTQGVCGQTIPASVTLTADILNCPSNGILVGADNIVLDCAGFSVTGTSLGNGIVLNGRTGVTIKNCNVQNFRIGIIIIGSFNTVESNTVTGSTAAAILLIVSNNNIIKDNTVNNNQGGISLNSSTDNTVESNTVTNTIGIGIGLGNSDGNTMRGNIVKNGQSGFNIAISNGNIFQDNTIESNTLFGIILGSSSTGNTIFHNNIIANNIQALDFNLAANDWHDPVLLEGNFWSDYSGVDDGSGAGKHAIAGDGIGDTKIPHPAANLDNFPFIEENGWEVLSIEIDIKPGSDPNCFNNDGKGVIPVAILSSATFDATTVDPSTVSLEGMEVKRVGKSDKLLASIEDSNGDGLNDLVVKIQDQEGIFDTGDTVATITGQTFGGDQITGTDTICITQ